MKILNLEVINRNGCFEEFMLDLLNDNVFAVDGNEDIACAELTSLCPSLYRRVEGVLVGADDRFSIDGNVNELGCLIAEDLNDPLQRSFACFGIGRPNKVTGFDLFDRNVSSLVKSILLC